MWFVVILHTFNQGGLGNLLTVFDKSVHEFSFLLFILSYCCVNCFGLISGFVGFLSFEHKHLTEIFSKKHLLKIAKLWFNIWLYTQLISLVYAAICLYKGQNIEWNYLIADLFPFTMKTYWYITAYFILLFCQPLLNLAVKANSRLNLLLMILLLTLYPVLSRIIGGSDLLPLSSGYSASWLTVMYLIGAFIAKYRDLIKGSALIYGSSALAVTILGTGIRQLTIFAQQRGVTFSTFSPTIFYADYLSPLTVTLAVLLLLAALRSRQREKYGMFDKVMAAGGKVALFVYIIHVNPLIWNKIVYNFCERYILPLSGVYLDGIGSSFPKAAALFCICILFATLCYFVMLLFAHILQAILRKVKLI